MKLKTPENPELLEKVIGYTYKDKGHLHLAVSHSSYAHESRNAKLQSNERLEFLGDAVLNITISEHLYKEYPHLAEGELTKARASIVCESSLVKCANRIGLGNYLLLGKGEELSGGRERTSILSDAFEALIGSIYLDGGMERAKAFILTSLEDQIVQYVQGLATGDFKTLLQEMVQKSGDRKVSYEIIDEKGPDHNKVFVSQIRVGTEVMGTGEGRSKKEAEQNAARKALDSMQGCFQP